MKFILQHWFNISFREKPPPKFRIQTRNQIEIPAFSNSRFHI
ncbi:MAG: hypothetical protein ACOYLG_06985 [Chitinophagaceae bacterium]